MSQLARPLRIAHVTTVDLTLRFLLLNQLRRLRDEGFEVTTISAPGPWKGALEAEGIRHIDWPSATRAWSPWSDVRSIAELIRIFRAERFDVVHTHNPKPGIFGRIVARLCRVPCVLNTVHGLYATPQDRVVKKFGVLAAEWVAARFSDLELYQSEEDLEWARRLRVVSEERSVLLGNGADLSRFDPAAVSQHRVAELRAELGIPEGALVVGTVGRLVAEKGYQEFFEAVAELRTEFPHARFIVAGGDDPEKADAITKTQVSDASRSISFVGWQENVHELLAIMDIFVLASWREGMPRSAIEAAAMGKALVLTDIRGCREVARDEIEALLVPPKDPVSLSEAIRRLLNDPDLRRRLGEAARARAIERFDEEKIAEAIVASTRRVLEDKDLIGDESSDVQVRAARPADAPVLSRLHREGLPDAFLPSLGDSFLTRLYRALIKDPGAVVLVAEDGNGVFGFSSGVLSVRRFYRRFILRDGIAAAITAAPRLARRSVLRGAMETVRYPDAPDTLPPAELLSIAVEERGRTRGVGRVLAQGVVDGLARRGALEVKVVVAGSNGVANRFYESVGFHHRSQVEVHSGTRSNVWVMTCPSS